MPHRFDHARVGELRRRLNLSARETARRVKLATGLPCTHRHVVGWETGTDPGADYVFGLAIAFGCTPNDLFEDFGAPPPDVVRVVEDIEQKWGINLHRRKVGRRGQ